MPQIHSVRQKVKAPQDPIMGGAMKGLAGFASNLNARKQQEKQSQDKLNLSLLGAYAQQNRDITKDPNGAFAYGNQNYSVGGAQPDLMDNLKAQQGGIIPMSAGVNEAQIKKQVVEALAKDDNFKTLMRRGKYDEADALRDQYIQIYSGQYQPEEKKNGNNWFVGGLKKGFNDATNPSIGNLSNPMSLATLGTAGLAKKGYDAVFGKKKTGNGYKKPTKLPDGRVISDSVWASASLQQQKALLDKYGL